MSAGYQWRKTTIPATTPSQKITLIAVSRSSSRCAGNFGIIYLAISGYRPLRVDLFFSSNGKAPFPAVVFLHGDAWLTDAGKLTGSSTLAKLAARS